MTTSTNSSTYGNYADYFNTSGGTKSQGKAGSSSGSAQQYSQPSPQTQTSSGGGSSGGSDNTQGGNAQSGANSWISAAVSQTSSDKSTFTTPFSQQFGGITNNQIIDSAGATGAVTSSPIAPITGQPSDGSGGGGTLFGGSSFSPVELALAIFAGIALILYVSHR